MGSKKKIGNFGRLLNSELDWNPVERLRIGYTSVHNRNAFPIATFQC